MDIKKKYNNIKFWAGLLLAQFFLFYWLSQSKKIIEWHFIFWEKQNYIHQKIFSILLFSLGDVIYSFAVIGLIYIVFISFKNIKKAFRKLLFSINIFYFIYQIFWGLLYAQPPIIFKLNNAKPTLEDAKKITLLYLHKCNESRKLVHENKNGVFYIDNVDSIKKNILEAQIKLPKTLINVKPTEINSIKPSLYSGVMNYTGILGYYNPFTAEAQYNKNYPNSQIPFTIAHESSHQLGIAREEEANFVGYLLGKDSPNIDIQYSTNLFVLKSLLNYLYDKDLDFVNEILSQLSIPVKRDLDNEKEFYTKFGGITNVIFNTTNDLFLKSNRQEGTINYSYFVDLLLRYETKELRFATQF